MSCATSGLDPLDAGALRGFDARDRLPTLARVPGEVGYASRLATTNTFFFARDDALGFDVVGTFAGVEPGRAEHVVGTRVSGHSNRTPGL